MILRILSIAFIVAIPVVLSSSTHDKQQREPIEDNDVEVDEFMITNDGIDITESPTSPVTTSTSSRGATSTPTSTATSSTTSSSSTTWTSTTSAKTSTTASTTTSITTTPAPTTAATTPADRGSGGLSPIGRVLVGVAVGCVGLVIVFGLTYGLIKRKELKLRRQKTDRHVLLDSPTSEEMNFGKLEVDTNATYPPFPQYRY